MPASTATSIARAPANQDATKSAAVTQAVAGGHGAAGPGPEHRGAGHAGDVDDGEVVQQTGRIEVPASREPRAGSAAALADPAPDASAQGERVGAAHDPSDPPAMTLRPFVERVECLPHRQCLEAVRDEPRRGEVVRDHHDGEREIDEDDGAHLIIAQRSAHPLSYGDHGAVLEHEQGDDHDRREPRPGQGGWPEPDHTLGPAPDADVTVLPSEV